MRSLTLSGGLGQMSPRVLIAPGHDRRGCGELPHAEGKIGWRLL